MQSDQTSSTVTIPFKRILFPVDFSERSRNAAAHVEAFANRFQAEVILLHVIEPPPEAYAPLEAGWMDLTSKRLDAYLEDEAWPAPARRIRATGKPATKIVEIAHQEEVDLIMMPTHGYGPFRRFVLGSVAAKVLHDADCAVWTTAHMEEPGAAAKTEIRSIVCAVDLDDKAIHALRWAAELAREFEASFRVAHAAPAIEVRPEMYIDAEFRTQMVEQAKQRVADLQREAGTNAEVIVHAGNTAMVIREIAQMHNADLLVISRGSHGLMGRLRTHGYAIVRESPCPVLSV